MEKQEHYKEEALKMLGIEKSEELYATALKKHTHSLTKEETVELFIKAGSGDMVARNELFCGNLPLVLSIINRFADDRKENMEDLFLVGCIGLLKAVDNFSIDLEIRFSTYAIPMIIGEIRQYLRAKSEKA